VTHKNVKGFAGWYKLLKRMGGGVKEPETNQCDPRPQGATGCAGHLVGGFRGKAPDTSKKARGQMIRVRTGPHGLKGCGTWDATRTQTKKKRERKLITQRGSGATGVPGVPNKKLVLLAAP